ncbi:MAG TPA: NADH-quinone oxidoreductase subunit M [Flavisolibacter sp.]|jgi:NADH-quinone oxidoreductase subunit M|nr:NADH-quinone oxidoreductase subunit M [Flavisolibacter sp.]
MIVLLLFLVPLIGGFLSFFIKNDKAVRGWSLVVSLAALFLSIASNTFLKSADQLNYHAQWMGSLGSSFSLKLDGLSQILTLLTAISYPVIFIATWKTDYRKPNNFFALMLLTQAGLIGVFIATDALLFYFFWELALIPVYFLCSGWGHEKRIPVTFKFFVYTFTASVVMLVAILYLYFQTPDHSFSIQSFYALKLSQNTQSWLFWLMFIAFAVKMPVFPFHTWQPDTYEQSPTAATMVLSAIMVKMGLFGLIRWVWPIFPFAVHAWGDVVMSLAVIGIIYASLIAIQQDDMKRLIAYSSIAHMGLMVMAVFSENSTAMNGVMIQMFNHGINILGLWIVVELIERQFGTRKLSQLGGVAQKAPALTALLVVVALANVALPLTNGFIGEFLMFNGIWNSLSDYKVIFTVFAIIAIILSAVYMLRMIQKIFYGNTNTLTETTHDASFNEKAILSVLVIVIIVLGVYPQPLLDLGNRFVEVLMKDVNIANVTIR